MRRAMTIGLTIGWAVTPLLGGCSGDKEVKAVCTTEIKLLGQVDGWTVDRCVKTYGKLKQEAPAKFACVKRCPKSSAGTKTPAGDVLPPGMAMLTCKSNCMSPPKVVVPSALSGAASRAAIIQACYLACKAKVAAGKATSLHDCTGACQRKRGLE